ncbi:MAG: type I-E CRISPR-associated protein Cas6/Cse3/CasE [Capsulimonadaceae bacterium]
MIYITELVLNTRSRQVQAELRDASEMHRTLAYGMGDAAAAYDGVRCLFRVEEVDNGGGLPVLVQSAVVPDWTHLDTLDRYLLRAPLVREFKLRLAVGQRLAFRLVANPTIKRDGRRQNLTDQDDVLGWLGRKAESAGFSIVSVNAHPVAKVCYRRRPSEAPAVLSRVRFDGLLVVRDPDLLAEAIRSGVGSSKGFGFGLLSIGMG